MYPPLARNSSTIPLGMTLIPLQRTILLVLLGIILNPLDTALAPAYAEAIISWAVTNQPVI